MDKRGRNFPSNDGIAPRNGGLCRFNDRIWRKIAAFVTALKAKWSGREDSNLRPLRPEHSALPG